MTVNIGVCLDALRALIEDVAVVNPDIAVDLRRDTEELASRVVNRGLDPLLIDLPSLGKAYDRGLSRGSFDWEDYPRSLRRSGNLPHLFEALLVRSFSRTYGYLIDPDPDLVFLTRCVLYLCKNVESECLPHRVHDAAETWLQTDRALRESTLDWDTPRTFTPESVGRLSFSDVPWDGPLPEREGRRILGLLEVVSRLLSFGVELDPWSIKPRHGPGAVADLKSGEDKYSFPVWPDKLGQIFPCEWFTHPTGDLRISSDPSDYPFRDPGLLSFWQGVSKLCAVPKTYKGPRLITIEPTAMQYIQQGVMHWMRDHLSSILRQSISFNDQQPSRDMALLASSRLGLATVDLSEASDRLSCWTVERCFHNASFLQALSACRSSNVSVDTAKFGPTVPSMVYGLRKFAGMGSAVTFPVQSIVYTVCAHVAVLAEKGRDPSTVRRRCLARQAERIRVFGDDIILPASALPYLYATLAHLQLKVNMGKTHWTGYFRESCGMDAYKGYEVTPFYLRHAHEDLRRGTALAQHVAVANNAYRKGLWHLCEHLRDRIPHDHRGRIPHSSEDLGVVTHSTFLDRTIAAGRRRNRFQTWSVPGIQVLEREERRVRESITDLLQYFLESSGFKDPNQPLHWEVGFRKQSVLYSKNRWEAIRGRVVIDQEMGLLLKKNRSKKRSTSRSRQRH